MFCITKRIKIDAQKCDNLGCPFLAQCNMPVKAISEEEIDKSIDVLLEGETLHDGQGFQTVFETSHEDDDFDEEACFDSEADFEVKDRGVAPPLDILKTKNTSKSTKKKSSPKKKEITSVDLEAFADIFAGWD